MPEEKHSCRFSGTCSQTGTLSGNSWTPIVSIRSAGAHPTFTNPHGENGSGWFLQTRNPVAILRDEYLNNRSSLLNKWESIQPEPHPDGAGSGWQDASSGQGQEYFQEPWQYCKEDKATAGIRRMPRYEPRKTAPGDIQIYPIFSL